MKTKVTQHFERSKQYYFSYWRSHEAIEMFPFLQVRKSNVATSSNFNVPWKLFERLISTSLTNVVSTSIQRQNDYYKWCERRDNVRSDLTFSQPLTDVVSTSCASWVIPNSAFYSQFCVLCSLPHFIIYSAFYSNPKKVVHQRTSPLLIKILFELLNVSAAADNDCTNRIFLLLKPNEKVAREIISI